MSFHWKIQIFQNLNFLQKDGHQVRSGPQRYFFQSMRLLVYPGLLGWSLQYMGLQRSFGDGLWWQGSSDGFVNTVPLVSPPLAPLPLALPCPTCCCYHLPCGYQVQIQVLEEPHIPDPAWGGWGEFDTHSINT